MESGESGQGHYQLQLQKKELTHARYLVVYLHTAQFVIPSECHEVQKSYWSQAELTDYLP